MHRAPRVAALRSRRRLGGCETERAEFADQSRRISRLRYTSPRHRPRLSMGIGERSAVPTLADTQRAPTARTADRGRDAAPLDGSAPVTNDNARDYGFSRDATHVRCAYECDSELPEELAAARRESEATRRSSSS